MEESFKSIIEKANSILILLPSRPYFDQVAAGLGLYLSLSEKKDVNIASPSPMTVEFNRLVGVNKVAQELGNKNLIIRFSDYQANDIERVSYDIEDGQFRLTVIPKPGVNAPKKDQAQISYSGVSADTIILIGGINETHFPALSSNELAGANIIHVGTKSFTSGSRKIISFARPASSTSEIIASLIKESGIKIEADIATNLAMGIQEGSNKFSSQDVSADTFQLVSELVRAGGQLFARQQRRGYPTGAIPQVAKPPVVRRPMVESTTKPESQKSGEEVKDTPKDWLEPKIFKGTSVS